MSRRPVDEATASQGRPEGEGHRASTQRLVVPRDPRGRAGLQEQSLALADGHRPHRGAPGTPRAAEAARGSVKQAGRTRRGASLESRRRLRRLPRRCPASLRASCSWRALVAYWAEGAKTKPWRRQSTVTFINSDPETGPVVPRMARTRRRSSARTWSSPSRSTSQRTSKWRTGSGSTSLDRSGNGGSRRSSVTTRRLSGRMSASSTTAASSFTFGAAPIFINRSRAGGEG